MSDLYDILRNVVLALCDTRPFQVHKFGTLSVTFLYKMILLLTAC